LALSESTGVDVEFFPDPVASDYNINTIEEVGSNSSSESVIASENQLDFTNGETKPSLLQADHGEIFEPMGSSTVEIVIDSDNIPGHENNMEFHYSTNAEYEHAIVADKVGDNSITDNVLSVQYDLLNSHSNLTTGESSEPGKDGQNLASEYLLDSNEFEAVGSPVSNRNSMNISVDAPVLVDPSDWIRPVIPEEEEDGVLDQPEDKGKENVRESIVADIKHQLEDGLSSGEKRIKV
jgi:hypothetical protein